jgi:hypothetical protein
MTMKDRRSPCGRWARLVMPTLIFVAAWLAFPGSGVAAQPVRTSESAASGSPVEIALPVPDGVTRSAVTGGDLTGRYLSGEAVTDSSPYPRFQPLLWVAGRLHVLPTQDLAPTVLVAVTDVNGHGVAIGARMVDYSSFHTDAWMYRNGRFTLLPGIRPTDDTQALAINSHGDVVGTSNDYTVSPVVNRGVVWPADHPGTVRVLTIPGEPTAETTGFGVDEDGTVIGYRNHPPDQIPYIWPPHAVAFPLTAPAGTGGLDAFAIRNGWVAGSAQHDDHIVVVRWNLRGGPPQIVLGANTRPLAVDNKGTLAVPGALIHRNGRIVALNGYPTVLTDNGIAAGATDPNNGQAVIWTGRL